MVDPVNPSSQIQSVLSAQKSQKPVADVQKAEETRDTVVDISEEALESSSLKRFKCSILAQPEMNEMRVKQRTIEGK